MIDQEFIESWREEICRLVGVDRLAQELRSMIERRRKESFLLRIAETQLDAAASSLRMVAELDS